MSFSVGVAGGVVSTANEKVVLLLETLPKRSTATANNGWV